MKSTLVALGLGLAISLAGVANKAEAIGISPSGGGATTLIFDSGGNLAGLFSISGASVGDTFGLADAKALQTSGADIIGVLAGDPTTIPPVGFQSGGIVIPTTSDVPDLFDDVTPTGIEVSALSSGSGSVFDAVFLVFDTDFASASGVIANFTGSTFAVSSNSTDLTPAPIPVPAAGFLILTGLAGIGAARFLGGRRKA